MSRRQACNETLPLGQQPLMGHLAATKLSLYCHKAITAVVALRNMCNEHEICLQFLNAFSISRLCVTVFAFMTSVITIDFVTYIEFNYLVEWITLIMNSVGTIKLTTCISNTKISFVFLCSAHTNSINHCST